MAIAMSILDLRVHPEDDHPRDHSEGDPFMEGRGNVPTYCFNFQVLIVLRRFVFLMQDGVCQQCRIRHAHSARGLRPNSTPRRMRVR